MTTSNLFHSAKNWLGYRRSLFQKIPPSISLEVTTKCNSKCRMCARQDVKLIPPRDIKFTIIEKLVRELKTLHVKKLSIGLTGLAEPLLNTELVDIVHFINNELPDARIDTITNAIALKSDLAESLIRSGLSDLTVSLNAGSKESYQWLCGINCYDLVVTNLKNFISLRKKLGQIYPRLIINFKITDRTVDEIESARESWKKLLLPTDSLTSTEMRSFRKDNAIQEIVSDHAIPVRRFPCIQLWNRVKIDIDGNVYPCCGKVLHPDFRTKSELFLGNIMTSSLSEIYQSRKLKIIRRLQLKDKLEFLPTCMACNVFSFYQNIWIENKFFPFTNRKWL